MTRTIAIAALMAALSLAVPQAIAGDTTDTTKMDSTGEAAKGAPSDQKPGTETSDRTPEKTTATPETQVDKTKEGETSDRTPKQ